MSALRKIHLPFCTVCKDENKPKTFEFFARDTANKKLTSICRLCAHERKERAWLRRMGAAENWYAIQFAKQEGKCAICGNAEPGRYRKLSIDHDHDTNRPRGLLCAECNAGIGLLKDSSIFLTKAAAYLARHGK